MPMMKRDYESVMNCLRDCITEANKEWPPRVGTSAEGIARELASVLKAENSRFDEGRFLRGCGIKPEKKSLPMVGMSCFLRKEDFVASLNPDEGATLDQSKVAG